MSKARDLASAAPAPSTVSATELGYVDGVTSAIQTQLDAKIAKTLTTTTGDIIYASSANTPARLGIGSTANVLTVSGGVPVWSAPAGGGKVLQVVQGTTSTLTTIASNSFTDTGLTATITPTLATSKVLVILNQNVISDQSGGQTNLQLGAFYKLFRDATAIWGSTGGSQHVYFYIGGNSAAKSVGGNMAIAYLDSPATTSATIYKTQIAVDGSLTYNSVLCQPGSATSSIILMEIGA